MYRDDSVKSELCVLTEFTLGTQFWLLTSSALHIRIVFKK